MRFRFDTRDVQRNLRRLAETMPDQIEHAVRVEAEDILGESRRYVPVDTGDLRDSGHVTSERHGNVTAAAIVFDAPYALYVHEDMEARHDDGQAKFLQSAMNEAAPDLDDRIGARIDDALGKFI